MLTSHNITPLNITGNTTPQQLQQLQQFLGEAVANASAVAIEKLDRQTAQIVLDKHDKIKTEFTESVVEIVERYTISDRYRDEEAESDREYPPTYQVRPIEAQVTALRKHFPSLNGCMEKLGRRPLPGGAEAWFALPRWQALAPSYNEALEMVLDVLGKHRKFSNRVVGKVGTDFLRQTERSVWHARYWVNSNLETT